MSLYEPEETLGLGRCAAHPVKPRPYIESELVDYAADMTIVMAYHSMLDNWNDDRSYPSLAFSKVLKAGYERVRGRYPRQCSVCERGLGNISRIERDQMQALRDVNDSESTLLDPDACANEFGAIMAEVLVFKEDEWSDELRSFGFELGRFVYQMDAVYDLPKDLESGSYNPFMQSDLDNDELRMLLMNRMAAVVDVFERLPLVQDVQILRSVLYAGVWGRLNARDQHDKETPPEAIFSRQAYVQEQRNLQWIKAPTKFLECRPMQARTTSRRRIAKKLARTTPISTPTTHRPLSE